MRDLNRALPLRPAQNLANYVTNTNTGSGAQTNSTQSGGYANQQWNANTINNYTSKQHSGSTARSQHEELLPPAAYTRTTSAGEQLHDS